MEVSLEIDGRSRIKEYCKKFDGAPALWIREKTPLNRCSRGFLNSLVFPFLYFLF